MASRKTPAKSTASDKGAERGGDTAADKATDKATDKAAERAPEKASGKKGSPSVASFLSKISTPRGQGGAASPAKGLLGGVTRADVQNVGRLTSADGAAEHDDGVHDGVKASAEAFAAPAAFVTDPGIRVLSDDGLSISVEMEVGEGGSGRKATRVAARHSVSVRGVFSHDVGGAGGDPMTRDLSAGGVFIETADLLEIGDAVVLSFPQQDGKRLVVNGRVRWVTPFGTVNDPTPGMGIEFVGVDAQKRARIEAVLGRG